MSEQIAPKRLPVEHVRSPVIGSLVSGFLAGLVAVVLVGGTRPTINVVDPHPADRTITVSGTGRVTIDPDIANLRLGVTVVRPTARAAMEDAATVMEAVVAAVKRLGVAKEDTQTMALTLSPIIEPPYPPCDGCRFDRRQPAHTYRATNIIALTIRKLDTVGRLIDEAIAAGATDVVDISFAVADRAAIEAQARTAAIDDARAKAETMADRAGASIVGVQSITETSWSWPILADRGRAADTPVEPGSIDVTVTVTVVYLIR
jgi:uncharacterized protein YggE